MKPVEVNTELVENFVELFLRDRFDGSAPIPDIHREWWDMCTLPDRLVSVAAPRGHAKTTAMTLAYTLCMLMFRVKKYVYIIGNSEDSASEFLGLIRNELKTNENLREVFEVADKWEKDGVTEIIVTFKDGYRFRVMCRGTFQPIRGRIWDNSRPDLIMIDDMEDDEAVENIDRRRKLKLWMTRAVLPALSPTRGHCRFVGTILHEDSLLNSTIKSKVWTSKLYKAHRAFDDFNDLLWPEVWSKELLLAKRQEFIDIGEPEGYSQEFLNDPSDLRNAFFRREDMIPMTESDHNKIKTYYVGADFALSDKTYSNYNAIVVGGYDEEGILHIVDVRRIRTDDISIIVEELFDVLEKWEPEYFIWEKGTLSNAIRPPFELEMVRRNKFAHIETFPASGEKRARAHPIQHRFRVGAVRVDMEAEWYPDLWEEMRKFPKSTNKDQVDSLGWLGFCINEFVEAPTETEIQEEEWEYEYQNSGLLDYEYDGTGYN